MKKILVFAVLFNAFCASSQDLKADFQAMNNYLFSLENFKLSVDYLAAEGSELEESGEVSVVMSQQGLFYDLGPQNKMIINEDIVLLIDDQERSLIYGENEKVKKRKSINLMDNLMDGLDTLVSKADTSIFSDNGTDRQYIFRFSNSYFDMVTLSFKGLLLSKVEYYYNSDAVEIEGAKNVCTISYEENLELDSKIFSTSFYLEANQEGYMPSKNFNNYLIIYNGSLENYID